MGYIYVHKLFFIIIVKCNDEVWFIGLSDRMEINALHTELFCMLLSSDFFQKSTFSKKSFWNTIRKSNSFGSNQFQHFVEPDLGQFMSR